MTLIEMMIVVIIVSIFSGVAGMSIYRGVLQERFRASVEVIEAQLQMAQGLMLAHNGNVVVELSLDEDRVLACIRTEIELTPALAALQCRSGRGVDSLRFLKEDGAELSDSFEVEFLSGGSIMSHGTLVVEGAGTRNTIELSGFPSPISRYNNLEEIVPHGDRLYPWDLVDQMQEALPSS